MAYEVQESWLRAKVVYLLDRNLDRKGNLSHRVMPWCKVILPDNDNEYIMTLPPSIHNFFDGTVETYGETAGLTSVNNWSGPTEYEYSSMRPVPSSTLSAPTSGVMSGRVDSIQNDLHYFGGI